jgi:hypothetical protein
LKNYKIIGPLLFLVLASGCSESGANENASGMSSNAAPSAARETTDSVPEPQTSVIGSWKHVSTAKSPDGDREPLEAATITWTFENDGSGSYSQIVKGLPGAGGTNPFTWKLSGKDIEITSKKGGPAVIYTIVKQSADEMTWRNNVLGDYYIVIKQ